MRLYGDHVPSVARNYGSANVAARTEESLSYLNCFINFLLSKLYISGLNISEGKI